MNPFEELEKMALNLTESSESGYSPSEQDITRWQHFFNYSKVEAADLIAERRKNSSRNRVSNERWEMVQSEMKAQGYDREAYEHHLEIGGKKEASQPRPSRGTTISLAKARAIYIVKLEGAFDTVEKIQEIAQLNEIPVAVLPTGDDRDASFCL